MTSSTGPERSRVAELLVTRGATRSRGSGYRVAGHTVLTAAHVVSGADSVQVRFEPDLPDEWSVTTTDWWLDTESDIAVLTIAAPGSLERAGIGRVPSETSVVAVQSVGFPLWKLREDEKGTYRDACHAVGTVAALSNWRSGTFEVTLDSAPAARDDSASPWEGMSGAALWVENRIVGVLAEHHPAEGLGRLTAARIDKALHRLGPGSPLHTALGAAELPVVPAPMGETTATAYRELLAEIAPSFLRDREDELDELAIFCAGAEPYRWCQAGPWAGKSALLSWFALNPPVGVDVVSFFITSRFPGQSDSEAYISALIEQLAALVGENPRDALTATARHGHVLRLLKAAAARSEETGRRLLLVVDGLDEDTGQPTIASLLPRRPPANVRILLASRPHPPLPSDVPFGHPLRTLRPKRLVVSGYAQGLEVRAKNELAALLAGPESQQHVVGLLAASGGGLTASDLQALTGRPPFEVEPLLHNVLGRTISGRTYTRWYADRPAEPAYLFGHETLRVTAEQQFGASIATYRNQIHNWAETYRAGSWGPDTPVYLMRGYPRMLAAVGDLPRLLACVTDNRWQDRILDVTGGDALALAEITSATKLAAESGDMSALVLLAFAKDRLTDRKDVPASLPVLWAKLGNPERAIMIANDDESPASRVYVLSELAGAFAATGDIPRARRVIAIAKAAIPDNAPDYTLRAFSRAYAALGDYDKAIQVAYSLRVPNAHVNALSDIAQVLLADGESDHALYAANAAINEAADCGSGLRSSLLLKLAPVYRPARLRAFAAMVESVHYGLAYEMDLDDVDRLVVAGRLAASLTSVGYTDLPDHLFETAAATVLTQQIPPQNIGILLGLAVDIHAAGMRDEAVRVAVQTARSFLRPGASVSGWTSILPAFIDVLTGAMEFDLAEELIRTFEDGEQRARTIGALIRAMSAAGMHDRAAALLTSEQEVIDSIANSSRANRMVWFAAEVARLGDVQRAMELADAARNTATGSDGYSFARWGTEEATALIELAAELADAGDHVNALRLATMAEEDARRAPNRNAHLGDHQSRLVAVLRRANDSERSTELATRIFDSPTRLGALRDLADIAIAAGDHDHARTLLALAIPVARQVENGEAELELVAGATNLLAALNSEGPPPKASDWPHPKDHPLIHAFNRAGYYASADAYGHDLDDEATIADLRESIHEFAENSDEEQIFDLSADQPSSRLAVYVLAEYAAALSAAGQHELAASIAVSAESYIDRADLPPCAALVLLATVHVDAGDPDRAEYLALTYDSMGIEAREVQCQAAIGEMLMAHGEQDRGAALLATIEDRLGEPRYVHTPFRVAFLQAIAAAGDFERAERLMSEVGGYERQIPAPIAVAIALAAAGQQDRAERVIRRIDDPAERTAGLGSILLTLADVPESNPTALILEVLATSAWADALLIMGRVALPALQSATDVLLGQTMLSLAAD